jgi:nitrilase
VLVGGGTERWQASLRHIAYEGRLFVVSCCQVLHRTSFLDDPALTGFPADVGWLITGGTAIVSPGGDCDYLAGPVYGEETILSANLDLEKVVEGKHSFDVAGHYARPDVLELRINRTPQAPLVRYGERSSWTQLTCSCGRRTDG